MFRSLMHMHRYNAHHWLLVRAQASSFDKARRGSNNLSNCNHERTPIDNNFLQIVPCTPIQSQTNRKTKLNILRETITQPEEPTLLRITVGPLISIPGRSSERSLDQSDQETLDRQEARNTRQSRSKNAIESIVQLHK